MDMKSSILRDKEQEQVYHSLLNEHFETVSLEKYNDAMLNIILSEAREAVLGKKFDKRRISKRKEKKIKDLATDRIRKKYGKWVNLTSFKIKKNFSIQFNTNLDRVFTVSGKGKLYGAYYHRVCGNIFFTEHCLSRFEEPGRNDMKIYGRIVEGLKDSLKADPTSVDILSMLIMAGPLDYGRKVDDSHIHLSIMSGILVMEDFGDVFIAKTFLSEEMIKQVQWHRPKIEDREKITSFASVLQQPSEKIEKPLLYTDMLEEAQVLDNGDAP